MTLLDEWKIPFFGWTVKTLVWCPRALHHFQRGLEGNLSNADSERE